MAIQLSENADAKLLDVRVSGKLTAEDYGSFEPAVEALISQVGKSTSYLLCTTFMAGNGGGLGRYQVRNQALLGHQ